MTARNNSMAELMANGQALVHSLAMRIFASVPIRAELDDLIAYGQLGLAQAATDYNPGQGTQFTTYAYYRVQGAIYDGISKMSWTSRARFNKMRRAEDAQLRMAQESGGAIPRAVRKGNVVTIDESDPDGCAAFMDRAPTPSTLALNREIAARLLELIKQLPMVEQRLIEDIYFEGISLQDSANRLGISKSWASRVHARTLDELGRTLRRMGAGDE